MATANRTGSSFHNMPYRNGTFSGNNMSSSSMEVTPDLHLKMSKKIAQLTKVIYALNTKNDEHDAGIEGLKLLHEEEMQQLIAETKEKIEYFKSRLDDLGEQKRKVQLLESHVQEEQLRREEAISEFEEFKRSSDKKEAALRSEYANKILLMSKELLTSKREFENRLKEFHNVRRKLEEDRDKAIEELSAKHHNELDELMKAHRVRYNEVVKEKNMMESEYKQRISQVHSSNEISVVELKKIETEYREKMDKQKALYEKELEVIRTEERTAKNELINEKLKEWDKREKAIKSDWNQQERKYKDRISELLTQLNVSDQQIFDMTSQLKELESQLAGREVDSDVLMKELDQVRKDSQKALGNLRDAETELAIAKQKCAAQGDEIERQSMEIHKYESIRLSKEVSIKNLKSNIDEMQSKLSTAQIDKEKLDKKFKTHCFQAGNQIRSLEEAVDKLTKEKEEIELKYQDELNRAKESSSDRETLLKKELEETINKMEMDHRKEIENLNLKLKSTISMVEEELRVKSEKEIENLNLKKNSVISNLEQECNELRIELNNAIKEVKRLEEAVQEGEKGLGSVSLQVRGLQQDLLQTKNELQKSQSNLAETQSKANLFQKEIARLGELQHVREEEHKIELQTQLQHLTFDLDTKWRTKLREDCARLESGLDEKYRKEKKSSLEHLTKEKESEKNEMKQDLEHRIDILKQTIAELQGKLDTNVKDATVIQEKILQEANRQRKVYEENIAKLKQEQSATLQGVEETHAEEIKKLVELKEQEFKDIEKILTNKHQESLTDQLQANKLAIDIVKSQLEQQRTKEIAELKTQYENQQEMLRNELMRKQQEDVLRLNRDFQSQLSSLTLQLQRAHQANCREREDNEGKLEELKTEVEHRDGQIAELDTEIDELKKSIEQLQREINDKGQEILAVRREATSKLRQREEHLAKSHQNEVDSLVADHLRETQDMLGEFNRAQDLLKDKISALQIMLEEAEERYRNRESRGEDLEMIDMLKRMLAEQELEMKKLVDEKRFFQLELMNRETNFNKVFNGTSPSVGVINPLQAKTKPGKSNKGSVSSLVSSTRLDPIPNTLTHEKRLNNQQPLPPTPPKDTSGRRAVVY